MAKDPAKELRSAIALSKKVTLNYGYCLGIDPWEAVWVTHKRKTPATLARQAKKDGNTAKTIYGQMTTTLNVISVTCEKAPPGRVAYNMKFFLKEFGLKYKVRLIGPDGTVLEESDADMTPDADEEDVAPEDLEAAEAEADDAEDAEAESGAEADAEEDEAEETPPPPQADPTYERWVAMREKLAPRVAAAVDGNAPRAADIERLWAALDSRAENGKAEAALAAVPALVKLLSEASAPPAAEAAPDSVQPPAAPKLDRELTARFKAAAAALKDRLAVSPGERETLLSAFAPARAGFEAKDNDALAAALVPLEALLASPLPGQGGTAAGTEARAEAAPEPPDLAALAQELKTIWSRARGKTDGELSQLLSRIASDGTEEGMEVARVGLTRWARPANQHMESALDALAKASPKRFRLALLDTAEAISAYQDFLLMHPAVEELEDNVHGVSITLTDTLGGALKDMSSAIARA